MKPRIWSAVLWNWRSTSSACPATCLNPAIAADIVRLFEARFDPEAYADMDVAKQWMDAQEKYSPVSGEGTFFSTN